jgi:hypothetical protein
MAPIDNRTRNAYAASDIVLNAREENLNMKRIAIYGTPSCSIHHTARKRENQPFPTHENKSERKILKYEQEMRSKQ